jgi:hypothetical protein
MRRIIPFLAVLLLLSVIASGAQAQDPVRVTAVLTADRVAVGTPTTLRITVETRGAAPDEIREPHLSRDLDIAGVSDFSQTQFSMPGGRSRTTGRNIVIVARRPGVYRIPPVIVRVDGRAYETDPLDLVVTGSGSASGAAASAPASSTLHMRLQPDTVYVGQQVLLLTEATFGEDSRSRQSRPASFDPPAPSGFWIQDMPDPVGVSLRVRDGRTVETHVFRRALFPLSAGDFTLPPARLHYEVRRGFLLAPEPREIVSDSVRLVVLPLPQDGRPDGFSGAVGRLRLRASVSPDRVAAGDAAIVTVEIEGSGNVKALPEPRLPEIDAEVFAPTQESTTAVVGDDVRGVKRFRWVIVPHAEGPLVIPPVEYSVFDPELRQYVTLYTDSLRVQAYAVTGANAPPADTALRPLRTMSGRGSAEWARSPAFAVLQLVPLALLAFGGVIRRRRDAPPGPARHQRRIHAQLVHLARRSDADVLTDLDRLLSDAVSCLVEVPPGDPVARLQELGRDSAAVELAALRAELQRLRYAPGHDPAAAGRLVQRAERFVESIAPPRRRYPWLAVMLSAAAAAPLLVAQATHAADSGRPVPPAATTATTSSPAATSSTAGPPAARFAEAATLLESGDAAAAANQFLAYAREHPRDPYGWYNVGVAAYQAGDQGIAVWAWLRAVRLAPRDADIRHNLRLAGGADALKRLQPMDRLAVGERFAAAAAAWWLLVFAIAVRRARYRAALPLGALAVLLLLAVGGAALRETLRPTLVTPLGAGATLFAGPSPGDQRLGTLPLGALAEVRERRAEWFRVRHADGEGWVERPAVAAP